MTRPYSEDIRERALARADAGETVRSIAAALQISPSCVTKWKNLRRETGGVSPGKIGGHKKPVLSGANARLAAEAHSLGAVHLAQAGGRAGSRRTCAQCGLLFTPRGSASKKRFCRPSKIARRGPAGRSIKAGSMLRAWSSMRRGSKPTWRRYPVGGRAGKDGRTQREAAYRLTRRSGRKARNSISS